MVHLLDDFYKNDGRTAYILVSDHGMTNEGNCYSILRVALVIIAVSHSHYYFQRRKYTDAKIKKMQM